MRSLSRRTLLTASALGLAGAARQPGRADDRDYRIGMTDWNLGPVCDPTRLELAAQAGLTGVQVSIGARPDSIPLRDPALRRRYVELGKRYGVAFPSVAAGSILNRIPLKSEPQSAVYVIDAVETADALGARNTLIAFFSNGDLRLRNADGEYINRSRGPFASYEWDSAGVERVIAALKQIAPRARDHNVFLGLENTLTAEQNLEILDRVGSPWVKIYYDVGNSTSYGYDVPGEIRRLGKERISEIHIKETLGLDDPKKGLLGGPARHGVDFDAVAAAVRDIGFDRWFVLELSGLEGRFVDDTRANVDFVRRRFL
ncbi:MAG: TIM barrel protein [Acidobacteria bacterium]|nr:TIM barrel protein [Acidobacteriota bacterium]